MSLGMTLQEQYELQSHTCTLHVVAVKCTEQDTITIEAGPTVLQSIAHSTCYCRCGDTALPIAVKDSIALHHHS